MDRTLPGICCVLLYMIIEPYSWGDFVAFVLIVSTLFPLCYRRYRLTPKPFRKPRSRYYWLWLVLAVWLFVYAMPRLSEPLP